MSAPGCSSQHVQAASAIGTRLMPLWAAKLCKLVQNEKFTFQFDRIRESQYELFESNESINVDGNDANVNTKYQCLDG